MAKRTDSVKEHDGGWFGVHDDALGPKAPPKRMFRSKAEADALDALLVVSSQKKPKANS
jgi:hypothetical protein